MTAPLWTPSPERIEKAAITAFRRQAEVRSGRPLADTRALHAWSVEDRGQFCPDNPGVAVCGLFAAENDVHIACFLDR